MSNTEATFPFTITDEDEYLRSNELLESACKSGDLHYLDSMQEKYHGVAYDKALSHIALENGHIEFFKRYTMLSRMTLIMNSDYENRLFWRDYLSPFLDAMTAKTTDEIRFQAVKFYFDEVLPNLPSKDEVVRGHLIFLDQVIKLPSHRHTIWSFPDFKAFNDPPDLIRCQHAIFSFSYPYMPILEYLSERINLRFCLNCLAECVIRFSPSLYNFVLNHLDPNLDKSKLPLICQYVFKPSDADFVHILFRACRAFDFLHSDFRLLEFLENYPEFRYKIPSVIEWIRARQALGPKSDFPENMKIRLHGSSQLHYCTCAYLLSHVERFASTLGPIDHSVPIQFESKHIADRIPFFDFSKMDQEQVAAVCLELEQLRLRDPDDLLQINPSPNPAPDYCYCDDYANNDDADTDDTNDSDEYDYEDSDNDDDSDEQEEFGCSSEEDSLYFPL